MLEGQHAEEGEMLQSRRVKSVVASLLRSQTLFGDELLSRLTDHKTVPMQMGEKPTFVFYRRNDHEDGDTFVLECSG